MNFLSVARTGLSLALVASGTAVMMSGPATAKMTAFSATCPTGITVVARKNGVVRINGKKAKVTVSNDNYYEAKRQGITISVAADPSGPQVSYTAKGGANGICTVANGADSATATPSIDEQACLQAVSKETGNGDVVTLGSEISEANTDVTIGVGPDRAPWKCLVKDGKVAEVMSLTDEGAL